MHSVVLWCTYTCKLRACVIDDKRVYTITKNTVFIFGGFTDLWLGLESFAITRASFIYIDKHNDIVLCYLLAAMKRRITCLCLCLLLNSSPTFITMNVSWIMLGYSINNSGLFCPSAGKNTKI